MNATTSNTIQTIAGLIGVTLGLIPLVSVLIFDAGPGLWSRILPDDFGPVWALPLATLVVSAVVVAVANRAAGDQRP